MKLFKINNINDIWQHSENQNKVFVLNKYEFYMYNGNNIIKITETEAIAILNITSLKLYNIIDMLYKEELTPILSDNKKKKSSV